MPSGKISLVEPSRWLRYLVAIFLVLLAAATRIWPLYALGVTVPYITFYPAVMISALYGGFSAGFLTMLLSALTVFFWHPGGQPFIRNYSDWLSMGVFLLNCMMISLISAAMLRAKAQTKKSMRQTEAANAQLKAAMQELELSRTELAYFNEQLKELDRAKTDFFSNVSHEFRTPLTLILGLLEEILSRPSGGVPQEVMETLTVANHNAQRLLKLVNTLLDFSSIEAGRARIVSEPTDLSSFTADLASNFRSLCQRAGIDLIVDCPPLPRPVEVDPDMWEKIVLNLVSNAFKFTFQGTIEVRMRAADEYAELTVLDTGIGIPDAELPHIFERFHRIEGTRGRTHEGSGIGLALVAELVRLNKGTIRVESKTGKGTSFMVRLPLVAGEMPADKGVKQSPALAKDRARVYVNEAARWLEAADESRIDGDIHTSRGRVLVADDNVDMRAYIKRLLEAVGYTVFTAANGADALALCKKELPDLVLADVMMPVLDGFGFAGQLRKDERTAMLPVILLSARAGEEARVEGLVSGADDYMVKPFVARELTARVDGAIKLAKVRREAAVREREIIAASEERMFQAQKLESLGILAGGIAHDFNNLLMSIRGNTEMALNDLPDHSQVRKYLEKAGEVIQKASELAKQMLAYSGKGRFVVENIDLSDLVKNTAELIRISIGKNVDLSYNLAKDLPQVEADAAQITQVVMNLIINASDAIGDKPGAVQVSTGVTECSRECLNTFEIGKELHEGTYVSIDVSDNGCGMDEETKSKMFDPFFTTKFTGRGLGLAAVLGIVKGHKGALKVNSKVGGGTAFRILLPKSGQYIERVPDKKKFGDWQGSGTVLLVEDEEDVSSVTKMMLERLGFSVLNAKDGREGIELFRHHADEIRAVVMDMTMPNMNGEEAFQEIKNIRRDVKVILTSGYNEEITSRAHSEGIAGFLQKPYGFQDLMGKIREVVGDGKHII